MIYNKNISYLFALCLMAGVSIAMEKPVAKDTTVGPIYIQNNTNHDITYATKTFASYAGLKPDDTRNVQLTSGEASKTIEHFSVLPAPSFGGKINTYLPTRVPDEKGEKKTISIVYEITVKHNTLLSWPWQKALDSNIIQNEAAHCGTKGLTISITDSGPVFTCGKPAVYQKDNNDAEALTTEWIDSNIQPEPSVDQEAYDAIGAAPHLPLEWGPFKILRVGNNATVDEINHAYQQFAEKWNPNTKDDRDKNLAIQVMRLINWAHDTALKLKGVQIAR